MLKILYHRDFDGAASAAMLMAALHVLGQEQEFDFMSVDYGDSLGWDREPMPGAVDGPFAVVDFQYHPGASYWFDHHPTAFPSDEWRELYDFTTQHDIWGVRWDPNAPSCAHMIWDSMPIGMQGFFAPLRDAADLIDRAAYPTPEDYFKATRPEIGLSQAFPLLTDVERTAVIAELARCDLPGAVATVESKVAEAVRENLRELDLVSRYCERRTHTVILDCVQAGTGLVRFAPFYYHPDAKYALTLYASGSDVRIALGKNPWLAFDPVAEGVHLGELARQTGGGGHAFAAGTAFRQADHPLPHVAAWAYAARMAARLNAAALPLAA